MGRYATEETGTKFKQAPAGNHVGRCVEIIDLGTQHGEYQGEPNVKQQIIVRWELPHETIEIDGVAAPMLVSKFYTNSLSEKANLRKDLESWRNRVFTDEELKRFDLMKVLGAPCMVGIIHKEGKAKVTTIGAIPKGTECPPAHNPLKAFWMDEWDDNSFAKLPDGFKKIIRMSDEWKALNSMGDGKQGDEQVNADLAGAGKPASTDNFDDDIPF
jgi:hypothetical protein